jgi:hypothetical protein
MEDISYGSQVILKSRESEMEQKSKGFYNQMIEKGMSTTSYRQNILSRTKELKKEGFSDVGDNEQMELFFRTEQTGRLLNRENVKNMKSQPKYVNLREEEMMGKGSVDKKGKKKKRAKSSSVNKRQKKKKIRSSKKKESGKRRKSGSRDKSQGKVIEFKQTGEIHIGKFDILLEKREQEGFEKKISKTTKNKKKKKRSRSRSSKKSIKSKKSKSQNKTPDISKMSKRSSKSRFSIRSNRRSQSLKKSRHSSVKSRRRRRSSEIRRKNKKDIEEIFEDMDRDMQEKERGFTEMREIETGQQSSQSLIKVNPEQEVQLEDFYRRYETGGISQKRNLYEDGQGDGQVKGTNVHAKNVFHDSDRESEQKHEIEEKAEQKEQVNFSTGRFESINTNRTRSRSRVRYQQRLKSNENINENTSPEKTEEGRSPSKKKENRKSKMIQSSLEDKFDNVMDFKEFSRRSLSKKKRKSNMYTESAYSDISGVSRGGSVKAIKNKSIEYKNYFTVNKSQNESVEKKKKKKKKKKVKKKGKKVKKSEKGKKIKLKKKDKKSVHEFPKDLKILKDDIFIKKKPNNKKQYYSQRSRSVKRNINFIYIQHKLKKNHKNNQKS